MATPHGIDGDGIDGERALGYLLRFLAVEGTTGREAEIGRQIAAALEELGVPRGAMRFDDAHERIPLPTESGNLVVDLDGDPSLPGRLFVAHRDTVPLCAGARPSVDGDRVVSLTPTGLGGDDRAGVACLVNMVATLRASRAPHPPLRLVFTVREESGLWGARCLRPELLAGFPMAFNVDGPSPSKLFIGAVGVSSWSATVTGRAAHAGLHPEQGISAPLVAAIALATAHRRGWWARVRRGAATGTSNAGRLSGRDGGAVGGSANVVADHVVVEGEARSHEAPTIRRILAAYRRAFEGAARSVLDDRGRAAEVAFDSQPLCAPFRLPPASAAVRLALERGREAGLAPTLEVADGGLDASWITQHGVPTVTFGVGQRRIHTAEEYVDVPDFLAACRFAVALARA